MIRRQFRFTRSPRGTALVVLLPCVWLGAVSAARARHEPANPAYAGFGSVPLARAAGASPEAPGAGGGFLLAQQTTAEAAAPLPGTGAASEAPEPVPSDAMTPPDGERLFNQEENPEPPAGAQRLLLARAEEPPPLVPTAADLRPVDSRSRFYEATVPSEISANPGLLYGEEQMALFSEDATTSKVGLRFGVALGLSGDDNINVSDTFRESELVLTVAPTVTLRLGSGAAPLTLTATYTAAAVFFLNQSAENSFDQAGRIDAIYRFSRLTLGLHLGMRAVKGSSLDVGERVSRNSYYIGLTSDYSISDKTSVELNADYSFTDYKGLLGAWEARVQPFVNRKFGTKLQLGIGGVFGLLKVDAGGLQTYEQWLVRAVYSPTAKLTINASAGAEFRQTESGVSQRTEPVFSIGAAWVPREKLTITLDARRRTYGSAALTGQNYQATGVILGASASLSPRLVFSLALGYEHTSYQSTQVGVVATRRDDYFYLRPSLDWRFSRLLSVGVFYEFSTNHSTGEGGRPFDRNRAGIMLSCAF